MDWWDIVKHTGSYKRPYRIQWDAVSGNVRARHFDDLQWRYANVSVKADCAEHHGYQLLSKKRI